MKIGVLVCTNSGIDYLDYNKDNVKIMRSILNMKSNEYQDYIDISCDEFYEMIKEDKNLKISTSQTPTGTILEILEKFKSEGFTDVIAIAISTKMSGTLSGVKLASNMIEDLNVHLFDSKSLSYGEYYMSKVASAMATNNKTPDEIINALSKIRDNNHIYVCVDTLHYLMLNGRLSASQALLGTLLQFKPVLYIDSEGSLVNLEKIRTKNKAKERLKSIVLDNIKDKEIILYGAYTDNLDEAESLLNEISSNTNAKIIDKVLVPLTPVVGCHAGPKTLGIGYIIF